MASLLFDHVKTPERRVSPRRKCSASLLDHVNSPQLRFIAAGLLNEKRGGRKKIARQTDASGRNGSVQTITMDQFTKLNQDAWKHSQSSAIYGKKIKLSEFGL